MRQVEQPGAALQHLPSNRNAGESPVRRELLTRAAKAVGLCWPPHPPTPAPRGLLLKPGEAERARARPSVALSQPLGMLQRSEKPRVSWGLRAHSPTGVANTCQDPSGGPGLWPEALRFLICGNGQPYPLASSLDSPPTPPPPAASVILKGRLQTIITNDDILLRTPPFF